MIVKPNEMTFENKNIIMIISGLPGVGKTTLALSAPGVVLIDADEGVVRVKAEHRKDTIIVKTYEELLSDIKNIVDYKTIVIDTGGALIDLLKDWAMRNEPSASKKSGGFSQQGFGFVKTEFLRFSAELRKTHNVIFLFHASKEKNNEEIFYDLVCEGSAKTLVWQPADLGAYLHMVNGDRYLGFSPTMNYNAKSSYGVKGLVKVPELEEGDKNDFLTKLFAHVKENIEKENKVFSADKEVYEKAMQEGLALISNVTCPEDVNSALNQIENLNHALTSQKELKAVLKAKLAELSIIYDKKTEQYKYNEQK